MAIYNPKRARELEAAARLAESQRQRELAKGQREQRTTEQILGLVEGLIGAAPQAAQAFEQSQAERVLAGERPLEMEAAKDPLTSLGRFLFEPGIQRKAQKMAQERAPAEVAKLRPTVKTVAEGVPEANKFLMPQDQLTKEGAVRKELERSPVLQLLPEREREALAFGEVQTAEAEQAAAERQRKFDEAQLALMEAKKTNLLTKKEIASQKVAPRKIKDIATALVGAVRADAQLLKENLNSSNDNVRAQAYDQLDELVDARVASMTDADGSAIDPNSIIAMSARAEVQKQIAKELELEPLTETALEELQSDKDTIEKLANLVERRDQVGFSPKNRQIIAAKLAQAIPDVLDIGTAVEELRRLGFEGELTSAQKSWLQDAMIMKQRLTTAEFKGTGAISDAERRSIISYVLDPMSTNEDFDQRAYDTIADISKKFAGKVNMYRDVNKRMPADWIKFADSLEKTIGEGSQQLVLDILESKPMTTAAPSLDVSEEGLAAGGATLLETPGKMIRGVGGDVLDYISSLVGSADPETAAAAKNVLQQIKTNFPQSAAPAAPPPPQDPSDMAPEVKYLQLRQQNQIDPQTQDMIIVNKGKDTFYYVVDKDQASQRVKAIEQFYPNATTQVYTGNVGGGL